MPINAKRRGYSRKAAPNSSVSTISGGALAEKFHIKEMLATGGMGSVFIAHHVQLDCEVVIKFMNPGIASDPDGRDRFVREARAAHRIGMLSDHAVRVMDFGIDNGLPYLVMERLVGETLCTRLRRVGPMRPTDVVEIARQLASVLKKAHSINLVHRDIKPENIFLTHRDERETVKLLDFGIIKELGPSGVAQRTEPFGTAPYMAPEQVRGDAIDHRVDLWAFGVVLYFTLTGVLPFGGPTNKLQLFQNICGESPPPPSRIAPALHDLDAFFAKALSRAPDERYQSAEELSRALAAALDVQRAPPASGIVPVAAAELPCPVPELAANDPPRVSEAAHHCDTLRSAPRLDSAERGAVRARSADAPTNHGGGSASEHGSRQRFGQMPRRATRR